MTTITIIGSWDTLWTPIVWCKQEACLDNDPKSNRYRFGLLIEHENIKILVDTNPDLKWQCIDNNFKLKEIDYILLTHTHSDHINWMWEFFYRRKFPTVVYHLDNSLIEKHIDYFRYLEREWVLSFKSYKNNKSFLIWQIKITPIKLDHSFPCSGFVIEIENKKISIISDTSLNIPLKSKDLLNNSDILFADTFSENIEQIKNVYIDCNESVPKNLTKNWFHMTISDVKKLIKEIKSKKTYTVHMSRYMLPHNKLVSKYGESNFIIGYDGLKIKL